MEGNRPNIQNVLELCRKYTNWGRWGSEDQRGTLNFIDEQKVEHAARLIKKGKVFSLAIPFDDKGPQTGGYEFRFNPMHLMISDGNDAMTGTAVRDYFGGRELYLRGANDIIIMHLHSATHWDALCHIFHNEKMYNGYSADWVTSIGALKNDICNAKQKIVGRGALLDIARYKRKEWLEPGEVITDRDLEGCANAQKIKIARGDIILIRTGQMNQVHREGKWGSFAGGSAPGLGLSAAGWFYEKEIAAMAMDTWGTEVLPNETKDVFQPLHIICIVYMGLTI